MKKEVVYTEKAGVPSTVYSQAVKYNGVLYVAGTMPVDPITNEVVEGGLEAQIRCALDNMGKVLEAGGSSFEDVLKCTVFITDIKQIAVVNEIYCEYFNGDVPARSLFEVGNLARGVLFEIDCFAACD